MALSTPPARDSPKPTIARHLAVGFGLLAVVAVAMYGLLFGVIAEVGGLVSDMQDDEVAISQAVGLSTAVREQYIHQAHCIVQGNRDHVAHYDFWMVRVRQGIAALGERVPDGERWRLQRLSRDTEALDDLFHREILPAVDRGDHEALMGAHDQVMHRAGRATLDADAIARAVEQRMARTHGSATWATRLGLIAGGVFVVLMIALSITITRRLRRAVLDPLDALAAATERIGAGDFDARVGDIGEGELQAVSQAFDKMAGELRARQRRLVRTERMAAIGQLAAGVAHEINNPIGVIRGYLRTMTPDAPPELREELQILDDEAAACQRIAEDLVAYARAPELSLSEVDMAALLRETARRFGERTEATPRTIEVRAEPGKVTADAGRLRQVLFNLLANADQVSPSTAPVSLHGVAIDDGGYQFAVTDRGPGIDPADRGRVFEPFFSKRPGGSGLGLAVCQGIVRAHGGRLVVAERDTGAQLVVTLPANSQRGIPEVP